MASILENGDRVVEFGQVEDEILEGRILKKIVEVPEVRVYKLEAKASYMF